MPTFDIMVLPGDGVWPEITEAVQRALDAVAARWRHNFACARG